MNVMAEVDNPLAFGEWVEVVGQSLVFKRGTPYEVWYGATKQLIAVNKRVGWFIGDALNYGEAEYGEAFSQVLEEYDHETLQNMKWVARSIPASRRHDALTFTHHAEVASLPPDKQEELLTKAEEELLTTRQVRARAIDVRQELTGGSPLWEQSIKEPGWLQLTGQDGQDEWLADVLSHGLVMIAVNGDSVYLPDIDDAIRRIYALKALAVKHFGSSWGHK